MMQYWADLLDALEIGVPPPTPEAYMPEISRVSMGSLGSRQEYADNSMGS
jgi:hypothetical protein